MSLFEEDPPRGVRTGADWEHHRRHRQPFAGPPRDEVGVPATSSTVLARGEDVVVALRGVTGFSDGLLLQVVVLFSDEQDGREVEAALPEYTRNPGRFRLGVAYADGRRTSAGGAGAPDLARGTGGPVLTLQTSRAAVLTWEGDYWLWPLPPAGPLTVGCRWPDRGVAEQRLDVDTTPLLTAAHASTSVWTPRTERP